MSPTFTKNCSDKGLLTFYYRRNKISKSTTPTGLSIVLEGIKGFSNKSKYIF